jgi:ribosome assembly protein RRB1
MCYVFLDSDGDSDEEGDVDGDPTIEHVNAPHQGCVNRIRSMTQNPGIIATMADTGHAHIYDFSDPLRSMMAKGPRTVAPTKPTFTFKGHKNEGYALDWSAAAAGRLATGDCAGAIHIWNSSGSDAASNWQVDSKAYTGHKGSVEDIQWSPTEGTVFGSASSDKTVKIWDTRGRNGSQISIDAHMEDVNVISWNTSVAYLLASGSDDGSFKVFYFYDFFTYL